MSGKMTPQQIVDDVRNGLRVTLTVGAARYDVGDDSEQLKRLGEATSLPLEIYRATGDPSLLLDAIQGVMGREWKPTGDWAEYLEAATK